MKLKFNVEVYSGNLRLKLAVELLSRILKWKFEVGV